MEAFVLKIITLNLSRAVTLVRLGLRLVAFLLVLTVCLQISSVAFERADLRAEEVANIAETKGIRMIAVIRLKMVWKLAIPPLSTVAAQKTSPNTCIFCNASITTINRNVPMVLNAM